MYFFDNGRRSDFVKPVDRLSDDTDLETTEKGKGGYFEKLSYGSETLDMTYEVLKVILQTRVAKKFPWCRWGAESRVKRAHNRERGPPSAPAEFRIQFGF